MKSGYRFWKNFDDRSVNESVVLKREQAHFWVSLDLHKRTYQLRLIEGWTYSLLKIIDANINSLSFCNTFELHFNLILQFRAFFSVSSFTSPICVKRLMTEIFSLKWARNCSPILQSMVHYNKRGDLTGHYLSKQK